ncbi:WXG100 family type VII secretion target [Streptomyces sp. FXJ1.172]|uniref:WXG100 family type VII secretion target n=1 Tax=Streptomyces sp. FXJ1.172 TaxID=710705 RepID=UPI0007CF2807|nr:WXG100 family type VII secretion target [Streptomyces sp. FXJ1.172]WEO94393.1 WXG100 family type VII secretion target [Streptomyces sp. FXJ1.172]
MSDNWVGGDIGGLRTMAETYKNAKDKLDGVVKPLSHAVDKLVDDASWKGDASSTFRARWDEDAVAAGALAELVHAAGTILETLANALSTCDAALKNAHHTAAGNGVVTDGKGVPAPPSSKDDQKTVSARDEYVKARDEILHTAQHARLVAAKQLLALHDNATKKDDSVSAGDKVTLYDALRGLYAYDAEDARAGGIKAREELDAAKADAQAAKKQLRTERKTFQQQGRKMPDDLPAKSAYRDALTKVDSLEGDIARADNGSTKLPYDRALNVKLADAADALRLGKGLEAVPDVLKELPVLDVAAAGACGLIEAKGDHDKGWSWQHSVATDEGANVGGLVAGAVIASAVMPATAPAAAVAVVGVGAALISTSVIDHSLHEHWSEDIHDHGVVGGVAVGAGHVATGVYHDGKRLAKDVWHGVTSFL